MTRLSVLGIFSVVLAASSASLGACSSSSDAGAQPSSNANDAGDPGHIPDAGAAVDADNGAPSTTYPAPHPDVPQVVSFGGPVLTAPHVIPIFFPGDDYQAQLETYLHQLTTSDYWAAATSQYGIGALTVGDSVMIAAAPPTNITSADVDTLIQQVASGSIALAGDAGASTPPDANTVYAVFYPTSTIINEGAPGYDSCKAFGGYHADTTVTTANGDVTFTYALVPRCPDFYAGEGLTGVDEVTAGLSHELVEAATDPFSETKAAYLAADDDHKVWAVVLAASETGDMCSWEVPSTALPTGVTLQTSRIWSNAAAKAGHDPCVPAPSDPYFATIPDLTEDVTIPEYYEFGADGKLVRGGKTKGIQLAVGESKTIDLVLYSDGPTDAWTVTPQEISSNPVLSFSLDRESGVNGERLHLTVTRNAKSAANHGASFLLYSSIGPATSSKRMSLAMVYVAD